MTVAKNLVLELNPEEQKNVLDALEEMIGAFCLSKEDTSRYSGVANKIRQGLGLEPMAYWGGDE